MANQEQWNNGLRFGRAAKITIISICVLALAGVLYYIYTSLSKCHSDSHLNCLTQKPRDFFSSVASSYTNDYSEHFETALIKAKGGVIIGFLLITIIYQLLYSDVPEATTYIGSPKYIWRALGDMLLTAGFGMLSAGIVMASRGGWANVRKNISNLLVIGIVLGSFNLAMETSGFNRYLAKDDIEQGIGPYAEIDGTLRLASSSSSSTSFEEGTYGTKTGEAKKTLDTFSTVEEGGDPFIKSLAYTATIIVGVSVLTYVVQMLTATFFGYSSGNNNVSDATIFGSDLNIDGSGKFYGLFFLELFGVVALLNTIPPLLSPLIRGEKYTRKTFIVAGGLFGTATILQLMLQYSGLLHPH